MTCARCGKANRDGARFCDGCGGSLAPRCAACGVECRPGAAFCDSCGVSLAPKSMRVQGELAPDMSAEVIGILALNDRGRVEIDRVFGTTTDGGGFENVLVRMTVTDGQIIRHCELFDVAGAERARTRFSELCAASSAARAAG